MSNLEIQCLENGLIIEDIPEELRTEKMCINALQWGLKLYKTTDCKVRSEMCFRIMNCFPKEILLIGFVRVHMSDFA